MEAHGDAIASSKPGRRKCYLLGSQQIVRRTADAGWVYDAGTDAVALQCPSNGATVFAMRHRKGVPKLNRPADQRKALLRSLTTEILRHGKITTTKVGSRAVLVGKSAQTEDSASAVFALAPSLPV